MGKCRALVSFKNSYIPISVLIFSQPKSGVGKMGAEDLTHA